VAFEGVAQVSSRGRSAGRSSAARTGRSGDERDRPYAARRDAGGSTPRRDAGARDSGAARDSGGARRSGGLSLAARRDRVREVIEPVIATAGYDLEDLALSRAGRRHLVRVVVDTDGGVSLDGVAEVSRAVSAALDAAEEIGGELFEGEYALEVGSPGVDRPLTLPRHWRRNVGRLVKVQAKALPGTDGGDRQLAGRVLAADETGIVLDVSGAPRELTYQELGPGRVQIEFTRLDEVKDEDLDDIDDEDDEHNDEDLEEER
jgi:ribosome maturation factor RimP